MLNAADIRWPTSAPFSINAIAATSLDILTHAKLEIAVDHHAIGHEQFDFFAREDLCPDGLADTHVWLRLQKDT